MESYAHIKHHLSQTWLHVDGELTGCVGDRRQGFNPEVEGLQWDSAELFEVGVFIHTSHLFYSNVCLKQLTTSQVKGDYDAFTLQEVDCINSMHGCCFTMAAIYRWKSTYWIISTMLQELCLS